MATTKGKMYLGDILLGGGSSQIYEYEQTPTLVKRFIEEVTYDPSDYSTSQIGNYAPTTAIAENYYPKGVDIEGTTYYNFTPQKYTAILIDENQSAVVKPTHFLRQIKSETSTNDNVRDIGGWKCDGGTIKYGLLYRGGQCGVYCRSSLVEQCGVRHDLSLRGVEIEIPIKSPLGEDIVYTHPSLNTNSLWYANVFKESNQEYVKIALRTIFEAVSHNEPVYFHCAGGLDRTGTLACILEAILGVSQSDIDKEYEISNFETGVDTELHARKRNEDDWVGLINGFNAYEGNTFNEKVINYVASLGFTAEEINTFRSAMIDGTPSIVTPSIDVYAVVNTLTNVINDNEDTSINEYQGYSANITSQNGYSINSVIVKMGGVDITSNVFKGNETIHRIGVLGTYNNCTTNNPKKAVIEGESYGAIITANSGYTLDGGEITIKIGGVDMSTYYKDGTIIIPKVTGDIEIIVSAVEETLPYTNQIAISTNADGSIYNTTGYKEGYRFNSSKVENAITTGTNPPFITGLIPIVVGDVVRMENCWIDPDGTADVYGKDASGLYVLMHLADKSVKTGIDWALFNTQETFTDKVYDSSGNIVGFTIGNTSYGPTLGYMRFCLGGNAKEAILTINEEIN